MTYQEAIDVLRRAAAQVEKTYPIIGVAMEKAIDALGGEWIPFKKRGLTEDEKKNHPEWCYILDGEVPEDDQEILLYRPWRNAEGYIIEMDRYCNNGDECYLEGAGDIENGMYWMSLPKPPKEGKQNEDR